MVCGYVNALYSSSIQRNKIDFKCFYMGKGWHGTLKEGKVIQCFLHVVDNVTKHWLILPWFYKSFTEPVQKMCKLLEFLQRKTLFRASLVAQWLRICLLMQGTQVRALVWEDPTCRGATGPVSHNY